MNNLIFLMMLLIFVSCNGKKESDSAFGSDNNGPGTAPVASDASATTSTITSSGNIIANGVSTAVVTISLKTINNIAIANVTPTFSATDTNNKNTYGACSSTNAEGVSTCTLATLYPEVKVLRLTSPITFNGGSVTFINDNLDYTASSITGDDQILADGSAQSQIRIKLVDIQGNPLAGIPTFKATDTGSTNQYGVCSALNSSGESVCTLSSTKAESKRLEILTPAYLSGSSINFIAGSVQSSNSTILSNSSPVANGSDLANITVTLKDSFGNTVSGITPTYSATDTGSTNTYGTCSPSDASGISYCQMNSKKAETKTLTLLSPVSKIGGTVIFVPGPASSTYSSIAGTTNIVANGTASSSVSIVLKDANENAITGVTPTFSATDSGTDNTYGTCSSTNASGVSLCTLSSLSPELKTLRLTSPLFHDGAQVKFLSPGMNLMVPIELLDRGVASNTTATIFDRSLYPLDTADYVASSNTYYFEIMATNSNASNDYTVNLLGNSNAVLATITIPKSTTAFTRFRSSAITMPAGVNSLKVRTNATAASSQVVVQMAKLLIKQVEATQSKLWIPLTIYDHVGSAATALLPVFQTSLTTFTNNSTYSVQWNRNDSLYTELDSSAYKFEGLMATNNATSVGTMAIYNVTDNTLVTGSSLSVTGTAYQWASAALNDPTTFLNAKTYEVRARADSTSRINYIFKAGISIKLTNLSKAEVANRVYLRRSATTTAMLSGGRILWEAGDYSNPKTYFETIGQVSAGGSGSRELDDMDTSDSQIATPVVVDDSLLTFTSTQSRLRSPEVFLTNGNRHVGYDRVNSGTLTTWGSFLVVKTTLR